MAKVTLVAKTDFLLDKDDEKLADFAAGICYGLSMGPEKRRIIQCIEMGHESIIEHISATFLIEDISRNCSHQIVRHRIASYSQESQRRVEQENAEMVMPPSVQDDDLAANALDDLFEYASETYSILRDLGISKEDARFALPSAVKTEILMTANLREWRHFVRTRAVKASQWEIRNVALDILYNLYEFYPAVFGDLFEEFLGE